MRIMPFMLPVITHLPIPLSDITNYDLNWNRSGFIFYLTLQGGWRISLSSSVTKSGQLPGNNWVEIPSPCAPSIQGFRQMVEPLQSSALPLPSLGVMSTYAKMHTGWIYVRLKFILVSGCMRCFLLTRNTNTFPFMSNRWLKLFRWRDLFVSLLENDRIVFI